jgi:hypothetical protein
MLWKELIRVLSADGQPTRTVLAQTCVGVFFIRSVSDTIFAVPFLPKPPRTTVRETLGNVYSNA